MAIKERLDHALHNEGVCNLLFESKKYDWTITTAFYSALHFVQHKIFPLKSQTGDTKKLEIPNFNVYMKGGYHPSAKSKHEVLIELVDKHCPEISPDYNRLFDICKNARYHQYQIREKTAKKAVDILKKIKEYCDPPVTKEKEKNDVAAK